jgi:hypothetical protein
MKKGERREKKKGGGETTRDAFTRILSQSNLTVWQNTKICMSCFVDHLEPKSLIYRHSSF